MKKKRLTTLIGLSLVAMFMATGCTESVSADPSSNGVSTLESVSGTAETSLASLDVKLKSGASFVAGDSVSKDDLVVTAVMSDGSKRVVTDWTFVGGATLSSGDNDIKISYTSNGVNAEAGLTVGAEVPVSAIVVTIDEAERYVGDTISRGDVHVNVQYSDGTEKPDVENWTCSNLTLEAENNSVKIEYGGKNATVVVPAIKNSSVVAAEVSTNNNANSSINTPDVSGNDTTTNSVAVVTNDPANDPTAPTGEIPATVTWSYTVMEFYDDPDGTKTVLELAHWVTHTVTTRNPGKHTVEYYQAHPWKLYNENNPDSLGSETLFFGEPPAYDVGSPWAQICSVAINGYGGLDALYNYTFRTPDDFNNFYNCNR